jgi:hypothetical protein
VKLAYCVLLVTLLCSCTAPRESGEGADSAEGPPEGLPFLDRANPLVKRTFAAMQKRAMDREIRETMRAEGLRVCEEGESGPRWQEDCNTCWCDQGHRACTKAHCHHHPWARSQLEETEREFAKQRHELREMQRARGERVCEEGESGPPWQLGCNTCWCERGFRACTKDCAPPPPPFSAVPRPTQPPEPDAPSAR